MRYPRSLEQPASVANYGYAQRGIVGLVGFDQPEQEFLQGVGRDLKGNMHEPSIVLHAAIVAIESEQNPIADTQSAEYSPAIQESHLAR